MEATKNIILFWITGFFTFDLFDLLILIPVVHYYIVFAINIKVWNIIRDSLCNKYAERSKAFSLLQENFFFKNYKTLFAFCNLILGKNNTSVDNSMQSMNKMRI